jgi:arylsulfatase A-like enzyme
MPTCARPNVLLILTDDQRHDTLSAVGHEILATPNLDRLAGRGTLFTHAHIPGGTSGAICMPSRAMLHTGRTLFHIQGRGEAVAPDHALLGETLGRAGYRTYATGKWHNGPAGFNRSFADGDDIFFGGMTDHWNVPAFSYDPSGRYATQLPYIADPFHNNTVAFRHGERIRAGRHSTDLLADTAIRFLEQQDGAAPFFLSVAFLAPHDPRTAPEPYLVRFRPADMPLPPNFQAQHPFDTGHLRGRDENLAAHPRDPDEVRRHIAEYYATIAHLDAGVGRILDALERRGLAGNTLVVFAGDNGLALGQHGLMGKQQLYDHSIRVPLILAGPGVPAGQRRDALVYLLDIFPTLCDLAGLPTPAAVEGRSFAPALADPARRVRTELYLAMENTLRGCRDERHKLIEYRCRGVTATQLFDLRQDPWETHNLAGDPACAGTLADLRRRLLRLRDEWDDTRHPCGQTFWGAS